MRGVMIAQGFEAQRRVLDLLAGLTGRPTIIELALLAGLDAGTARRCLQWLEIEGFLTTPRPEGRGFQPSPAGVPVSRPTAPGVTRNG